MNWNDKGKSPLINCQEKQKFFLESYKNVGREKVNKKKLLIRKRFLVETVKENLEKITNSENKFENSIKNFQEMFQVYNTTFTFLRKSLKIPRKTCIQLLRKQTDEMISKVFRIFFEVLASFAKTLFSSKIKTVKLVVFTNK